MHRLPAHFPIPRHLRHRPPAAEDRHDRLVPLLSHAQLLHAEECQASRTRFVVYQPKSHNLMERETSVGLTQDNEWSGIRLVLTA